jgi:hypothetical protein
MMQTNLDTPVLCCKFTMSLFTTGFWIFTKKENDFLHQHFLISLFLFGSRYQNIVMRLHGCQMVSFQTKNPNMGKFWRVLQWKMLVYFMDTWSISQSLVIFYGHSVHIARGNLVYFSRFGILYEEKSGNPVRQQKSRYDKKIVVRVHNLRPVLKANSVPERGAEFDLYWKNDCSLWETLPCDWEVRGHCMCKESEMPVIPVSKVVDPRKK